MAALTGCRSCGLAALRLLPLLRCRRRRRLDRRKRAVQRCEYIVRDVDALAPRRALSPSLQARWRRGVA